MNVYNKSSIIEFYKKNKEAKLALEIWYEEMEKLIFENPNALKNYYGGNASILKNSRVVFNIRGNKYRLVASINYEKSWVFIKFIGSHIDYDAIDANLIDLHKPTKKFDIKSNN